MPRFPRTCLGSSRWWLKRLHSHSRSPNVPSCSQHCGKVSSSCSAAVTTSLPRLRWAAGEGKAMQTHTHRALLSLFLPPLCTHLCVLQTGAAALRPVLPFTVIHGTRSSHSISGSFFLPPTACLCTLEQQRWCQGLNWPRETGPRKSLSSSKLDSTLLVAAAALAGPAGLQKLEWLSKLWHGNASSHAGSRNPLSTYSLFWLF